VGDDQVHPCQYSQTTQLGKKREGRSDGWKIQDILRDVFSCPGWKHEMVQVRQVLGPTSSIKHTYTGGHWERETQGKEGRSLNFAFRCGRKGPTRGGSEGRIEATGDLPRGRFTRGHGTAGPIPPSRISVVMSLGQKAFGGLGGGGGGGGGSWVNFP